MTVTSGLKSAQEKTMWGAFDTPNHHPTYHSDWREAQSIINGVGALLSLPKAIAATGRNTRAAFENWLYDQKNSSALDNVQLSMGYMQMIQEVLTKNENNAYFAPYGNAHLLEILAVREATTQLPLMNHTRNPTAYEKIENLQGNEIDITHYILNRKKRVRELQIMLSSLVVIYDEMCRYMIKPESIETLGGSSMYLASEYGRVVHFGMAESVCYGFHINPMYSEDASFYRYPSAVKEAFSFAGGCENLKLNLEKNHVNYIHPMEYLDKLGINAKNYVKDNLNVVYADNNVYDQLVDIYMIEASKPFLLSVSRTNATQEVNEDNALAVAMEYFEKTKTISYDAKLLGENNHLVRPGDTLFDILVGTVIDIMQVRQLSELAVAQARFLNHCIVLDERRQNFVVSQLFARTKEYLTDNSEKLLKTLDPADASIYDDSSLMEELFFHQEVASSYLQPIVDFNSKVRNWMKNLVQTQAEGLEKPIYHPETDTWHEALKKQVDPNTGLVTLAYDTGVTTMQEHNKQVENLENNILANMVNKVRQHKT